MKASLTGAQALEIYARSVGPVNRESNVAAVRAWLLWGGQPSDAHLAAYVKELQRRGLASGTIDRIQRTIRSFYVHIGVKPPRKQWRHDSSTERRPAASDRLVRSMIALARSGELDARQVADLVLMTTYGLRVGEVAAVQAEDVDLERGRFYVRAEKGSVSRWMRLPVEIAPYVAAVDWWPRDVDKVAQSFASVLAAMGVKRHKGDGYGVHMVRRALVKALRDRGVPDEEIAIFMRWSLKGKGVANAGVGGIGEVERYSDFSAVVDVDGESEARPVTREGEEDALVWERHPWRGEWG